MGCDELKSPILFFLVHRLRIEKKTNLKIQ